MLIFKTSRSEIIELIERERERERGRIDFFSTQLALKFSRLEGNVIVLLLHN